MIGNAVKFGVVGCAGLVALSCGGRPAVGQDVGYEDPTRSIQATCSSSIIAVRAPETNRFSAFSLQRGLKWKTYTAPPGTKLTAVASGEILALSQDGPDVKEIAVFEPTQGEWKTHPLPEPAKHAVSAHVLNDVAIFVVGKHVYAYRGKGLYWSTLSLPAEGLPVVMEVPNAFLVQQGTKLYVYSTLNGTWSDAADAEPAEEVRGSFHSVNPKAP